MGLKLNKRYKYKQLCAVLGVEPKRGGAQQSQIKQLSKLYQIEHKEGYYIVRKQYDTLEKVERQSYYKNKSYIEPMLYTILASAEHNVLELDMKQILQLLAVVNHNFFYAKWNITDTAKIIQTDPNGLSLFIGETEPMLRRIVMEILHDMENKQLIKVQEIPKFATKYVGENGQWYTEVHTIDDENEYPEFLRAKQLALKELGAIEYNQLNYFQKTDFKHLVEAYLKKTLGVSYYYYSYKIILNKTGINEMLIDKYSAFRQSFNTYLQQKIKESKRKNYLLLESEDKNKYIDALININTKIDIKNMLTSIDK